MFHTPAWTLGFGSIGEATVAVRLFVLVRGYPMSRFTKFLSALPLSFLLLLSLSRAVLAADLVIGTRTEPAALDPHHLWSPVNNQLSYHYLGFMARTGPEGKLLPSIGLKWEAIGTNEWRFAMDPRAKFSNGDPVTVGDA